MPRRRSGARRPPAPSGTTQLADRSEGTRRGSPAYALTALDHGLEPEALLAAFRRPLALSMTKRRPPPCRLGRSRGAPCPLERDPQGGHHGILGELLAAEEQSHAVVPVQPACQESLELPGAGPEEPRQGAREARAKGGGARLGAGGIVPTVQPQEVPLAA